MVIHYQSEDFFPFNPSAQLMSGILSAMTELIHDNEKVIGYIHITRMFVDPSSKCFQSVAQLAERSFPTPEIRGLTPSSAKYYQPR